MADGRNTTAETRRNETIQRPWFSPAEAQTRRFVFLLTADKDEGAGQKYDSQRPTGHPGVDRYVDSASSWNNTSVPNQSTHPSQSAIRVSQPTLARPSLFNPSTLFSTALSLFSSIPFLLSLSVTLHTHDQTSSHLSLRPFWQTARSTLSPPSHPIPLSLRAQTPTPYRQFFSSPIRA